MVRWVFISLLAGGSAAATELSGTIQADGSPVAGADVAAYAQGDDPLLGVDCLVNLMGVHIGACNCPPAQRQVEAWLHQAGAQPLARAVSDAQGRFTLSGNFATKAAVVASHREGVAIRYDVMAGSGDHPPLSLALARAEEVRINVDSSQKPAPARGTQGVAVNGVTGQRFVGRPDLGALRFEPLPRGTYLVVVTHGNQVGTIDISETGQERTLSPAVNSMPSSVPAKVSLVTGSATLDGTVAEATGPVPVEISGPGCSVRIQTDASGAFHLSGVQAGSFEVRARDRSAGTAAQEKVQAPGTAALTLTPQVIRGRVTENHRPLAQAPVSASGGPSTGLFDIADADGRFVLGPALQGEYLVSASGTHSVPVSHQAVEVRDGGTDLAIDLVPSVPVKGTVQTRDGALPPWLRISLRAIPDAGAPHVARVDEDGHFDVYGVTPGAYTLSADGEGIVPTTQEVQAPVEDVHVQVERRPAIRGQVTVAGKPLAGASIVSHPVAGPDGGSLPAGKSNHSMGAAADANGRFEVPVAEPGWYQVSASATVPGSVDGPVTTQAVVEATGPLTELAMPLAPGADIQGVVLDPKGRPLPAALVWLSADPYPPQPQSGIVARILKATPQTTTDRQGHFRFAGLHAAQSLEASKAGLGLAAALTAQPGATGLVLKLVRLSSVRGTVRSLDGNPPPSFQVNGRTLEDGTGNFSALIFASGTLPLDISAPGFVRVHLTPTVVAEKDLILPPIALHPERHIAGHVIDGPSGHGVHNYLVRLTTDDPYGTREAGYTDPQGHFDLITGRTGPTLALEVLDTEQRVVARPSASIGTPLTITLAGPGGFTLTVRNPRGGPAPLRQVEVTSLDPGAAKATCAPWKKHEGAWTNAQGTITCSDLLPGRYRVTVHDLQGDRSLELDIKAGVVAPLSIDLGT